MRNFLQIPLACSTCFARIIWANNVTVSVCLCSVFCVETTSSGNQLRPIYGKVHIYTLLCCSPLRRNLYTIGWLTKFENLNPLPFQTGHLCQFAERFLFVCWRCVFGFAIYFVFAQGYDCWYFFFFSRKFHETLLCFCVIVLLVVILLGRGDGGSLFVISERRHFCVKDYQCTGMSLCRFPVSLACLAVYRWFRF